MGSDLPLKTSPLEVGGGGGIRVFVNNCENSLQGLLAFAVSTSLTSIRLLVY